MTATIEHTLTHKQRKRLDEFDESARVVGWNEKFRGPIVLFTTGVKLIVTRDGGFEKA